MSDMIEVFEAMADVRKRLRHELGQPCSECVRLLPRAHPKILLPGGYCRMHRHNDPRPASLVDDFYKRLSAENPVGD